MTIIHCTQLTIMIMYRILHQQIQPSLALNDQQYIDQQVLLHSSFKSKEKSNSEPDTDLKSDSAESDAEISYDDDFMPDDPE